MDLTFIVTIIVLVAGGVLALMEGRHHWTFVVWCVGFMAAAIWLIKYYVVGWMDSFDDWRGHAIFIVWFGALLLIGWVFERRAGRSRRPEHPPTPDE